MNRRWLYISHTFGFFMLAVRGSVSVLRQIPSTDGVLSYIKRVALRLCSSVHDSDFSDSAAHSVSSYIRRYRRPEDRSFNSVENEVARRNSTRCYLGGETVTLPFSNGVFGGFSTTHLVASILTINQPTFQELRASNLHEQPP